MPLVHHLIIFCRWPRLGAGKSRLARGIGTVQALRFQRVRLAVTLGWLGGDRRWRTWLAVTPDRSGPWPRHPRRVGVLPQGAGDLGRRMAAVARRPPPGPVVIIGTDIPGLDAATIAQAFRRLGNHDAVFAPALDGGYGLVGLRRRPGFLDPFRRVRWSTEHALADTLDNLGGRAVARLEPLEDIDDADALARHPGWERRHAHRRT